MRFVIRIILTCTIELYVILREDFPMCYGKVPLEIAGR